MEDKYVPKPNTGSLFKSSIKTSEFSPDLRGDLVIDTRNLNIVDGIATVKISGWKSTSKTTGKNYISLKIDQWVAPAEPKAFAKPQPKKEMDDDLDF